MKLIREAKTLSQKAICSMRIAMTAFNSYDDEGRVTLVLMSLQHSGEMLLKAVLCQRREAIFDKKSSRSLGFEKCLGLCTAKFVLTEDEAGVFRTIDKLRDAAQHWYIFVSEDLLYLHTRAMVTAFDSYIKRALELDLHSSIPPRVLPVSTIPPGDFDFLVDREYRLISELLAPGRRQRDEARGRIRTLLAMEALVHENVEISESDINRIEKAVRDGQKIADVFPRLNTIAAAVKGDGPMITVHFSKKEGAPVRYVGGDDPDGAAAVRQVDLQKKFHMRASELATAVGLTEPRSLALRKWLNIDKDSNCFHVFEFGSQKISCFSDNAAKQMRDAKDAGLDMEEVWRKHRPGAR
jgi:hypothetical protein